MVNISPLFYSLGFWYSLCPPMNSIHDAAADVALHNVSVRQQIDDFRNANLDEVLTQPLPFKIPVVDIKWVSMYPDVLCLGRAEYAYSVDLWLGREWAFGSETAVTSLDQAWVHIITTCLGGTAVFLNQHDPSSAPSLRPDTTIMKHGALVLKGEAKRDASEMEAAKEQMLRTFFPDAVRVFPRFSFSVLGVTTCGTTASIYKICWMNGTFSAVLHRDYNLQTVPLERLNFIVDIFKAMRWMMTVDAPVQGFHLVPAVRRQTRNNHHVTWTTDGIVKEYSHPHTDLIARILEVYAHKLAHVEWGHALYGNPRAVVITRVAVRLAHALATSEISKDLTIEHIRLAITELHDVGYAHCDIMAENVFVDKGVAFLDDLEYLTPINDAAPVNARWDPVIHPGLTAFALGELLFARFAAEVMGM